MNSPTTVRAATAAWTLAVAAGVAESALAVTQAVQQNQFDTGDVVDVGIRLIIYSLATTLVVMFGRGRRWARTALTVLLTGIGLATLVIPAVQSMIAGQTFVQAFSDGGRLGWAFVTVRLLHIGCVLTASVLMYTPSANRRFARADTPRQADAAALN